MLVVGASIARPLTVMLLDEKTIFFPSGRITVNVIPNFQIILFSADHMIMEKLLPNTVTDLFCDDSF